MYVLLCSTTVFVSCKEEKKKEPDPVTPTPTKTQQEFLSDTTWKITGLTATGLGDVWNNTMFVKPCNQDNTYYFKLSNILTSYDTPNKCNTTDPDSTSGPYKLIDDNKKIYLELLIGTINIKDTTEVQLLDANTMILNAEYSGIPAVITFKHK